MRRLLRSSSQQCTSGGWETTNWNRGSDWIWRITFSPWGQPSSGICPARLCSLHPWRVSRADWTKPWAIRSDLSWPCLEQKVRDFLRSTPNWITLLKNKGRPHPSLRKTTLHQNPNQTLVILSSFSILVWVWPWNSYWRYCSFTWISQKISQSFCTFRNHSTQKGSCTFFGTVFIFFFFCYSI